MSGSGIQQTQRQLQGLVLTPQLRQSLRILQVPATELRQVVGEELAANPLLEEAEPSSSPDPSPSGAEAESTEGPEELRVGDEDFDALRRMKEDWDESYYEEVRSQGYSAEDEDRRRHQLESVTGDASLGEHLLGQARLATSDPGMLACFSALVGALDERGFLEEDLSHLALDGQLDYGQLREAHALLLGFDPVGIGARNLRECYLTQLRAEGREPSPALRLVEDAWEDLMARRLDAVARALGYDAETMRQALDDLARLETAPARRFRRDDNRVVTPDATVAKGPDGKWTVTLDDRHVPRLRIAPAYKDMLAGRALSEEDRAYILERMRQGRFLIGAIEERQRTLERLARILLERQSAFFEEGPASLRPLTMAEVAGELGVHETTVSRAAANKWMSTPWGLREFRSFFSSGVATEDGGAVAASGVQEIISEILSREDPAMPLSDEAITAELQRRGLRIARRTVAKYRDALGLPSAHLRRRR
jgi:RNA polymerase sigma-54 factor